MQYLICLSRVLIETDEQGFLYDKDHKRLLFFFNLTVTAKTTVISKICV